MEKYFLFEENQKKFAIELEYVVEVVKSVHVEPFIEEYESIHGLINYRGKIIPVIDISYTFFNKKTEIQLDDKFIILTFKEHYFVFHVSNIIGVEKCKNLDETDFNNILEEFKIIKGVLEFKSEIVPLLNLELFFTSHKLEHLKR